MNIINTLLISLMVAFIAVGVYEIAVLGMAQAYWSIMVVLGIFFLYTMRKKG